MPNIHEQLIGTTWTLVSFESIDTNGLRFFPLGDGAKGYIVFDQTGLFSVQIMAEERLKPLTEEELALFPTEAEKQMAQHGYHAYSGHYAIDEAKGIMKTTVELSLVQEYIGSEQQRAVKIRDNHLYLSNVKHPGRKLVWKKNISEADNE